MAHLVPDVNFEENLLQSGHSSEVYEMFEQMHGHWQFLTMSDLALSSGSAVLRMGCSGVNAALKAVPLR